MHVYSLCKCTVFFKYQFLSLLSGAALHFSELQRVVVSPNEDIVERISKIKVEYSLFSSERIFKYSSPFVFIYVLRFNTFWIKG